MKVAGVVLAAGASRRLGRPKQLVELWGRTLLDHALDTARGAGFDQVVLTLGGSATRIRATVDLSGVEVVDNPGYGSGCASSVAAGLARVRPDADGIVLLLGDQPGVQVGDVRRLVRGAGGATVGVCRYDDGRGHPLWFHRRMFGRLADLHGDKAVWKLVDRASDLVEVRVPGPVPRDLDTWEDYRALTRQGPPAVRR